MSKYIIDIPKTVGMEKVGSVHYTYFGSLQDDAYNKGYAQCQDDYSDALKHAKDTAYKKGLHDGESKCRYCNEYQRGLDDAWEAAKKIADMWTRIGNDELLAIFGITERIGQSTIRALFEKQTANEAMLELEAYEEKQRAEDEIKVGDEVERYIDGEFDSKGIYLNDADEKGDYWNCLFWTGACFVTLAYQKNQFKKTGRYFDIASILKEMQS